MHFYWGAISPRRGEHFVLRSTGKTIGDHGIKWGGKTLLDLDYADDLSILDESVSKMNEFLEILRVRGARIGLKINVEKTKSLRLGTSEDEKVTLGSEKIDQARSFTYLRSIISKDDKNSIKTGFAADRESKKRKRAEKTQQQCENRLAADRESKKRKRTEESQEQQENRLAADRESKKRKRAEESQEQPENYRLAFRYSPVDDYSLSRFVQIGTMSKICPYCNALKFNGETMGMCCASGKVELPLLAAPPEPLKTLLTGNYLRI